MDAEKDGSESTEPQQKLDKEATAFSFGLCGYLVIVCIVVIGSGVWCFYQTPETKMTSDRISFALLAALATYFAFCSLGRIFGPLLSERLATIYNRVKKAKLDPYQHWFARLDTVLNVLRGIVTAGLPAWVALNSKSWEYSDSFAKLFDKLFNFCGVYLAVDTAFAIVILVLAIVCWIFDKGVGQRKPIKRELSAIIWNSIIFFGAYQLMYSWLPALFKR